jgi:Double zinc ribbon
MICNFCGTENRDGNKFCGVCGVRIERRKADRRVDTGAQLNCLSCGHVNESGYKFCGMCGTRIDRRVAERRGAAQSTRLESGASVAGASSGPNVAVLNPQRTEERTPGHQRASDRSTGSTAPALFRTEPGMERFDSGGIRGPSFLGLSDDPDDDPGYLLEEEPRSRGGLRFLVLLVILAAIAGLIFLQYRSSLNAKPHSNEPGRSSAPAPQGENRSAPVAEPQNPDKPSLPAGAASTIPQSEQSPAKDPPSAQPQRTIQPEPHVTPAKAETSLTAELDPPDDPNNSAADARETSKGSDKGLEPVPAEQKPSSTLIRAQQFLHGRGVEQNCEQGLLYLRAAAQKNEPAAAVQMGALYASGQCVKQDRVMAYRWFNSAHELQPANQWILRNMDQLWGQMTEQERRLAGY